MKNEEVEELSVQLGDLTIRISKRTDQPDLPPSSEVIRESPAPSGALAGSSGASHSATQAGRGSAQSETWELVTPTSPAPWTEDWEAALVAAVTPEAILQLDLSPVRHLLSRIRTTSNGWTPLARLGRALRAGIQARQKLDTGYSHPGSTSAVTLPTKVYLVLQPAPGGQTGWTEDFHTFARQVREPNTNLHPHSVSHGFPSRAEADAYLLWSPAGMAASAPAGGMNEENIRALWNAQTPTGPLPGLFLVLPAREDGTGQRVACHLVKIRSGGFMVIFPALSAVADFLEGQEAAAGIEPYALYEASTEMETSRGRRLGAESCLLADLVWDLAPLFIRAHSLRTASVEVHKFMVGDTVGRPRRAEAIACADQWIHEVMDDDTAGDYVTGESDALEAHEPELLPASGTEGVDLEAMQRRIHELEQMLQSPGSPGGAVLRPVSKASAKSSPARGVLFGGTQTIPSEAPVNDVISRLRAAAGAAPMRLAAHERALREGMPETNLNALQSEVGLEAVEDGEIESGLKDLVCCRSLAEAAAATDAANGSHGQTANCQISGPHHCCFGWIHRRAKCGQLRCQRLLSSGGLSEVDVGPSKICADGHGQCGLRAGPGGPPDWPRAHARVHREAIAPRRQPGVDPKRISLGLGLGDGLQAEQPGADGVACRGLVFTDQTAIDYGRTNLSWLLTTLPEPQYHVVQRNRQRSSLTPFSRLASPSWIGANVAFMKDLDFLETKIRSANTGPKPTTNAEAAEEGPKKPWRPKKKKAAAGAGSDASQT